jgi:hypothetical protein
MSTSYTTESTTTVIANDSTQQPRGTTSITYTFENGDQSQAPGATIVGDIIPGQEANARAALEAMGTLPFNDPNFDLEKLETIHFARFMLINNDTQVLFSVIFDGDLEEYIRDFHDIFVRNNVTPSFQYCEGFPENWKEDLPGFSKFYRDKMQKSIVEYSAYPYRSVRTVKKAVDAYDGFTQMIDSMQ